MTATEINQPNPFRGEQPLKILVVGSVGDAIQQARYYEKRLSDERFEARLALDIRRGDKTFSDSDARKVLILTANHVGTALDLYAKNQDLKAIVLASTLFNEWWHTPEDYNARPHMVAWHIRRVNPDLPMIDASRAKSDVLIEAGCNTRANTIDDVIGLLQPLLAASPRNEALPPAPPSPPAPRQIRPVERLLTKEMDEIVILDPPLSKVSKGIAVEDCAEIRVNYPYRPSFEAWRCDNLSADDPKYLVLNGDHWERLPLPLTPQQDAEHSLQDFIEDRGAKIVGCGWGNNCSGIKYNRNGEKSDGDFDLHEGHYFSLIIERADLGKLSELYKIARPVGAADHHPTSLG